MSYPMSGEDVEVSVYINLEVGWCSIVLQLHSLLYCQRHILQQWRQRVLQEGQIHFSVQALWKQNWPKEAVPNNSCPHIDVEPLLMRCFNLSMRIVCGPQMTIVQVKDAITTKGRIISEED